MAQPFDSTLRGPFEDLALSADGKHLAITQDQKTADVWTKELEHGPISKVSLLGGNNWAPAWSKDGRFITFMHADDAVASLWKASADGSGQPIKLVEPKARLNYGFASADGQWLIYQTATGRERTSTLIAQRVSDTATIVISDGTVTMINPRLSPDGHWLAYALAGAGTAEVVVSPFPNVNASRAQVSVNGGILPVWSPTGTELFYRTSIQSSAAMLIAARIETSPTFRVIERTPLFNVSQFNGINGQGNSYDVSPDGTRFVMTRAIGDRAIRLMLVEHWATELAGMGARQ